MRGAAMITLPELLEDKAYREFFTTKPSSPPAHPLASPPWRVYIQRRLDGPWARRDFRTYTQAFKFIRPHLKTCHDGAIQSKGVAYRPPGRLVRVTRNGAPIMVKMTDGTYTQKTKFVEWRPHLPEGEGVHHWCPYCRRPTVFRWFSNHHAFPKGSVFDPSLTRCIICGASERLVIWNA